jgi:hypothetical protein
MGRFPQGPVHPAGPLFCARFPGAAQQCSGAFRLLLSNGCLQRGRIKKTRPRRALILCVRDESEPDYSSHKTVQGLEFVGDGRGRGLLQYSSRPANSHTSYRTMVPWEWIVVVRGLARCAPESLTPRLFWRTIARQGGFIG